MWRDIIGFEGTHKVSEEGRVLALEREQWNTNQTGMPFKVIYPEREIKACFDSHGYLQVVLRVKGKKRTARVHRLVAECFLEKPSKDLVDNCCMTGTVVLVNHKDGNKTNNHFSNLEWCNSSHNQRHALSTGLKETAHRGESTAWGILKEKDVDKILSLRGTMSQKEIGDMFGVKQITISNIFTGRSWAWYTGIMRKERSAKQGVPLSCGEVLRGV